MKSSFLMTSSALLKDISGDVGPYACNNSRMAAWIFVKLGMNVVPLEANPDLNFYFRTTGYTNVTDAQSLEVGRR
jgi:hypothetical protein